MQKRKCNKSKSSAHGKKIVEHSGDSSSLTSSPSDKHERKRVRWEGKSATEDSSSADTDSEDESPEKVRTLNAYHISPTFITL